MSRSHDDNSEGKCDGKYDEDETADNCEKMTPPKIEILSINFEPPKGPLSDPLELSIKFELDRDVVAGYWIIRFLVDSCDRRLIKVRRELIWRIVWNSQMLIMFASSDAPDNGDCFQKSCVESWRNGCGGLPWRRFRSVFLHGKNRCFRNSTEFSGQLWYVLTWACYTCVAYLWGAMVLIYWFSCTSAK